MDNKAYDFLLSEDLSQYRGKWIAVCDNEIVSFGDKFADVHNDAKIKCKTRPLLSRVPDEETMIF